MAGIRKAERAESYFDYHSTSQFFFFKLKLFVLNGRILARVKWG